MSSIPRITTTYIAPIFLRTLGVAFADIRELPPWCCAITIHVSAKRPVPIPAPLTHLRRPARPETGKLGEMDALEAATLRQGQTLCGSLIYVLPPTCKVF
jgi:hypothetical protein